ncbi:hypothetical protein N7462_001475 [Penicillium macrosclerotiorum]|uniref:uncharacterized protein n=1 Tax=Penicillium macrosclerotiorum TaxID=303699 RepID=UPI0025487708|nr:uncharacterized protein N7462_001475 [Penicillium macrosclerotiorum]KAJ5692052.1 hypothetical protein N7462_001475 [Penicillium macrosclerotiorum]
MDPSELYTAEVVEKTLRCISKTGEEKQVDLKHIVGVTHSHEHHQQPTYRVLFLADAEENRDESPLNLTKCDITSLPVVISTRSGTGMAHAVFQSSVKPLLEYLALDYLIFETQSAETIIEISRSRFLEQACAGVPQTIILLSGDGGLIDIVDVFYKSARTVQMNPCIALVPCGTGNAMASSLGLRSGPISGLTALLRGQPLPVPIFTAKFSPGSQLVIDEGRQRVSIGPQLDAPYQTIYGAVVTSWGLHAALVADSDTTEYRKFGSERFKMAAKELLYPSNGMEPHRFQGQITLTVSDDGSTAGDSGSGDREQEIIKDDEHMYVLATLVPRLEKDFLISPESEPLDGQMRFLRFGPLPAEEAMRLMTLAYQQGQHVLDEKVLYKRVDQLRIEFQEDNERWRRVCVDGKIVAVAQGGWMELSNDPRQLLCVIKPSE